MIICRFICIIVVLALFTILINHKSCKKSLTEDIEENYKNTNISNNPGNISKNNNFRINKSAQRSNKQIINKQMLPNKVPVNFRNVHPPRRRYPKNFTDKYFSNGYHYPGYYYGANALALPFTGEYSPVYNLDYVYPENTMYTMIDNDTDKIGWYRIGLLIGNKKNCRENCKVILTLFKKTIDTDREIFEYKIKDDNKPGNFEIFLPTNIYFRLEDGDEIPQITGYEEFSPFTVHLDTKFRYAVVRTK